MSALTRAITEQTVTQLGFSVAQAATFSTTPVDISDYEGLVAIHQIVTAATGAQTLAGIIQTSDDVNFVTGVVQLGAAFPTFTASALGAQNRILVDTNAAKRYVRYNGTVAGSTPSFTACILLTGSKKVQ